MEKTRISIHRALTELKVIDDRISKKINDFTPVGIYTKGGKVNDIETVETHSNNAKKHLESIIDLNKRKQSLRRAIMLSNATAMISIGDIEMTVAEAIAYRDYIEHLSGLRYKLATELRVVTTRVQTLNDNVDKNALKLAEAAVGKDSSESNSAQIKTIVDTYKDKNRVNIADPLGAKALIEKLDNEISSFSDEIDSILSESNATTFIEV